jgi:hypothetical protein
LPMATPTAGAQSRPWACLMEAWGLPGLMRSRPLREIEETNGQDRVRAL